MRWNFPIARRGWDAGMAVRRSWLDRHRHPVNFWVHIVGIPLGFASLPLLFVTAWYWSATAFVVGYGLQWAGHRVEGNDLGELVPVKRLLGLPYVAVAPQYQSPPDVRDGRVEDRVELLQSTGARG